MSEPIASAELTAALNRIRNFVAEITGKPPDDAELAWAMTRYFVLKEICDHIDMKRLDPAS
ncbi:MAG TPA: hypothetical protein VLP30_01380 [Desulfatirhabdiaceae bacterium]|nr:hypothetical protein [Desulfatirhabdiaceae bacterium]